MKAFAKENWGYAVGFILIAILLLPVDIYGQTIRRGGDFLQKGDVTSNIILDATITNADISATAGIEHTKLVIDGTQGDVLITDGTRATTTSTLSISTSTPSVTITGALSVTASTTFNGTELLFPSADGSSGQVISTNGAGALTFSSVTSPTNFGTGADGTCSITANATTTADKHCSSATVDAGVTWYTGGFRIYVQGTLTNNGIISGAGLAGAVGGDGASGVHGVGGVGGVATAGTLAGGTSGTDGGVASDACTDSADGAAANPSMGVSGSTGGRGGDSDNQVAGCGDQGDNSGTATAEGVNFQKQATTTSIFISAGTLALFEDFYSILGVTSAASTSPSAGSGGGEGGRSRGTGRGGGGGGAGASGGNLFIAAKTFTNNGTTTADGGNGGAGGNAWTGTNNDGAGGGGAGGGAGGVLMLVFDTFTENGTTTANGGTAGAAGAGDGGPGIIGAGAGTAGLTGKIYKVDIN